MRAKTHHLGFVVLLLTAAGHSEGARPPAAVQAPAACAVTKPNGIVPGGAHDANSYGNAQVSVGPFGLWPDGTVVFKPGGAGFVTRDGSLGMKFGWTRGVRGPLRIEGRRLDAPGPPLRAEVPNG